MRHVICTVCFESGSTQLRGTAKANMSNVQTRGFNRFNVLALAMATGLDFHASFMGTQISDKLIVSLREQEQKLSQVKFGAAKEVLLVIDARSVYVWKVKLVGDAYERSAGKNVTLRGSLAVLRATYGASNVSVMSEAQVTKLLTTKKADKSTLAFYGLSALAKSEEKKDTKAKGKKGKKDAKKRVKVSKSAKELTDEDDENEGEE